MGNQWRFSTKKRCRGSKRATTYATSNCTQTEWKLGLRPSHNTANIHVDMHWVAKMHRDEAVISPSKVTKYSLEPSMPSTITPRVAPARRSWRDLRPEPLDLAKYLS